ncbi:cytochrome C biogenesis protein [Vibrio cyclitrophicus]|uniref:protein-disulfide reductase DsbD family protein n=1 Tax=Vibrio cyclitrophicus TaxID=47951 RepID=UPI000C861D93|nr:protein-disulfide reductase DsbD domain-containing protein [Vibrio cyclitrophicus]PME21577.1 cytochrome C biogenesis protein [Vibrio cyclitrophicus]
MRACTKTIVVAILAMASFTALAQTTGWISAPEHPPVKIRMMSTGEQSDDGSTVQTILDVELDGDWKTYWRSPGEGGIPPSWDWSDSTNIESVNWHWPIPKYYEQLGVMTLGYKKHVSFPVTLTLKDNTQAAVFRASLSFPSCTNICVLTDYDIELPIDTQTLQLDEEAMFLFNQGMSQSPREANRTSVNGLFWDKSKQQLVTQLTSKKGWDKPQVLIDGQEVIDDFFAQPAIYITGNTLTAVYDVSNWLGEVDLTSRRVSITVSDTNLAEEMIAPVGSTPITYQESNNGLGVMLGFALIGGLILNIMPCVLPVLGMKLNSIIHNQGASNRHIRISFLASAMGVITSFALLAFGMTVLKMGGNAIGWGIQFQNVWFIAFMLIITLLFSVNLLGLVEFRLPSGLNTWIATKGDDSHSGHFVQGMFATLLATPCSAPFLGTAVAYALGASYQELWAIFIALGIGMSAPWLIFATFPNLTKLLPKPGAWMFKVKLIFGLMMFATSLWLASLMTPFIGKFSTILMSLSIVISVLIWIGRKLGRKVLIPIVATTTLVFGAALIIGSVTADNWATPIVDDLAWQKLDSKQIPQLVEQGKTVFVDVTAEWCITCKANKIGVILQNPVYNHLQQEDIVLMKGDWTTPSESVTQYLQSNGRFGVPFNIVYGPSYKSGIPLPIILDSDTVVQTLDAAR